MSKMADTSLANLQFCAVTACNTCYAIGGLRYGFSLKAKHIHKSIGSLSREYSVPDKLLVVMSGTKCNSNIPLVLSSENRNFKTLAKLRADGLFKRVCNSFVIREWIF
jgi:hypothetical protein